ncbi:MAG: AAA family ATPase [Pseudomonadota bacterium]
MYHFRSVSEDTEPLRVSVMLAGGSGSGKTYTACLLARGLTGGEPWGFVDTEGDRGKHYAREFPEMMRLPLSAEDENGEILGYPPERMIEVIQAAEQAGMKALIIDSFSHGWEGVNGILEQQVFELDRLHQAAEAKANGRYAVNRDNFSQLAWAQVKPRARRLTNRIIQAEMHVILCVRAKPLIVDRDGKPTRKNKIRRADLPWDVAADKDMVFEMTASFIMDPERPGCSLWPPIKLGDTFKNIVHEGQPIGMKAGQELAKWSKGDHDSDKAAYERARTAARSGAQGFTAYWNSDQGKEDRAAVKAIMPELQRTAQDADASAAVDDDDPMGINQKIADQIAAERAAEEAQHTEPVEG